MFKFNNDGKLEVVFQQKIITRNKQYNYKEVTIPIELYHLWTQQQATAPDTVTLVTIVEQDKKDNIKNQTFVFLRDQVTKEDVDELLTTLQIESIVDYYFQQLKIRINKGKPTKSGKQKQKATMSINKGVTIISEEITFTVNPYLKCSEDCYGLTSVDGLIVMD